MSGDASAVSILESRHDTVRQAYRFSLCEVTTASALQDRPASTNACDLSLGNFLFVLSFPMRKLKITYLVWKPSTTNQVQFVISLSGLLGDAGYPAVAQSILALRTAACPHISPLSIENSSSTAIPPPKIAHSLGPRDDFRSFLRQFNARSRFNRLGIQEIQFIESSIVSHQSSPNRELDLTAVETSELGRWSIIQSLKGDKYFQRLKVKSTHLDGSFVDTLRTALKSNQKLSFLEVCGESGEDEARLSCLVASIVANCLILEEISWINVQFSTESWSRIITASTARLVHGRPRVKLIFPSETVRELASLENSQFEDLMRILVSDPARAVDWRWPEVSDSQRTRGLSVLATRVVSSNSNANRPIKPAAEPGGIQESEPSTTQPCGPSQPQQNASSQHPRSMSVLKPKDPMGEVSPTKSRVASPAEPQGSPKRRFVLTESKEVVRDNSPPSIQSFENATKTTESREAILGTLVPVARKKPGRAMTTLGTMHTASSINKDRSSRESFGLFDTDSQESSPRASVGGYLESFDRDDSDSSEDSFDTLTLSEMATRSRETIQRSKSVSSSVDESKRNTRNTVTRRTMGSNGSVGSNSAYSVSSVESDYVAPVISDKELEDRRTFDLLKTAVSVEELVNRIATGNVSDLGFASNILLSYRVFMKSRELFEAFVARFRQRDASESDASHSADQVRVLHFLHLWSKDFVPDLVSDLELVLQLKSFVNSAEAMSAHKTLSKSISQQCDLITASINNRNRSPSFEFSALPTSSGNVVGGGPSSIVLLTKPEVLADALTSFEMRLFSSIESPELVNQAWSKGSKEERQAAAPNVCRMIDYSNRVANWAATDIVFTSDLKTRGRVISGFIKVARCLYERHNFNGTFEILSGLAMACVTRLKKAWALVKPKYRQYEADMQVLTSLEGNYKHLRAAIKASRLPVIPYVGVYLTDLTFLDDGNKTWLQSPDYPDVQLINLRKVLLLAETIREIQMYQQVQFANIHPDEKAAQFFRSLPGNSLTPGEMFAQSLLIEPREPQNQ